jgi:hypothetical protein
METLKDVKDTMQVLASVVASKDQSSQDQSTLPVQNLVDSLELEYMA